MKELPISEFMNDFFKEKNITFTDSELATIVWNAPLSLSERLKKLKEIADFTENTDLKGQIAERIDYENEALKRFGCNSEKKYIYIVSSGVEEDRQYYFNELDNAVSFARKSFGEGFKIEKNAMSDGGGTAENKDAYGSLYVGTSYYAKNGELQCLWSGEMESGYCCGEGRFEDAYIILQDQPFEIGDIVHYEFDHEDEVGVVANSHQSWLETKERHKNSDPTFKPDYSDIQLRVEYPDNNGSWYHKHCCIFYIEKVSNIEDEEKRLIIETASELMSSCGNKSLEYFTYCCEKYRKSMKTEYDG